MSEQLLDAFGKEMNPYSISWSTELRIRHNETAFIRDGKVCIVGGGEERSFSAEEILSQAETRGFQYQYKWNALAEALSLEQAGNSTGALLRASVLVKTPKGDHHRLRLSIVVRRATNPYQISGIGTLMD